jgi:hypothetical protein
MARGLPYTKRGMQSETAGALAQRVSFPIRALALTVSAAGAGVGFGNAAIGAMPKGNILFLGAAGYFRFTTTSANISNATYAATFGVGSTADADGSLATTEIDIIGSTTTSAAVAKVSPVTRAVTAALGGTEPLIFDNTGNTLKYNLNLTILAADIVDASSAPFTVEGVLHLAYVKLGDT